MAFGYMNTTIGHNWKIGSFTSGPHPGWFGPDAGSYLITQGKRRNRSRYMPCGLPGY
ncbi:hypothetical protein KHA80_08610 [Anaerobacillus sp. HL2]|nr:hypothetical protein KHA80_08610 [Anaerobacillus sp. HL2]